MTGVNEMWLQGYEEGKREARAMKRHRSSDAGHDGSESYGVCQQCVADALDVDVLREAVQRAMTDNGRSVDYSPLASDIVTAYRAILAERQQDAATDEAEKEWTKPLPKEIP